MFRYIKKTKTIAIITGGTGGHVLPAQHLAETLAKKYNVIVFIDNRGMRYWKHNSLTKSIKIIKSDFFYYNNKIKAVFLATIPFICLKVLFYLFRYKVQLVISFGSYASFAPLCVSNFLSIPIMIHEQNMIMGRVNTYFEKRAKNVLLSFESTKIRGNENYILGKKYIHTWNPIFREEYIYEKKEEKDIYIEGRKKIILITGGSQGSSFINESVIEAFKFFTDCQKEDVLVYHQSRADEIDKLKSIYKELEIKNVIIEPYFYNIKEILKKADIFIGRSGSSTMFEVIYSNTPSIFIPAKYAKDNHQYYNALYFSEKDMCKMMIEDLLIPRELYCIIIDFLYNINTRKILIENTKYFDDIVKSLSIISHVVESFMLRDI